MESGNRFEPKVVEPIDQKIETQNKITDTSHYIQACEMD